jgi:hypothetical protein
VCIVRFKVRVTLTCEVAACSGLMDKCILTSFLSQHMAVSLGVIFAFVAQIIFVKPINISKSLHEIYLETPLYVRGRIQKFPD